MDDSSISDPDLHGFAAPLISDLREGLDMYWRTAADVLSGSGVHLSACEEDYFSVGRNFFSLLFLYSYFRAGIPVGRRRLYVAVNQCLRGMVTGCDNLLDDEYKPTLETDLPVDGRKFRSVLDIMVSDRVLFEILLAFCSVEGMPHRALIEAGRASLAALTRSGAQEASEEAGVDCRLPPDEVLTRVHHFKTGILFRCPWAIPSIIEQNGLIDCAWATAHYDIGMGCQVMDDAVDLPADLQRRRHNYVASVIAHSAERHADHRRGVLEQAAAGTPEVFFAAHPELFATVAATARRYLESGLSRLFAPEHRGLMPAAERFIARRIGFDRLAAAASGAG